MLREASKNACPIPQRLRAARKRVGLSQKSLGISAGIDEASASPRMNQYEKGTHTPTYEMLSRIAKVLNVPTAYFFSQGEDEAAMLLLFHNLKSTEREKILLSMTHDLDLSP